MKISQRDRRMVKEEENIEAGRVKEFVRKEDILMSREG